MNEVSNVSPAATRRPVSHRKVWIGLAVLALVILAVFGGGYWLLVRYEPKAARHIPSNAVLAARVDIEQVVLYEPIRKHLFPVLDGGDGGGRLKRFKALSGVNLGMDLREIVVAVLPDSDVTIAIGGLFPAAGLVSALYQVTQDSSSGKCTLEGLALRCGGVWFQQADDGTLVVATSERALEASVRGDDWAQHNGLPTAPLAMVVKNVAGAPLVGALPAVLLGGVGWLGEVRRFTVSTDLGDPLQVELALDGLAPSRLGEVKAAVGVLQAWAALRPGADVAGEREVLSRLKVEEAAGRPVLRSQWSRSDVERAVRAAADFVAAAIRPFQPS